jgi:hypothetical protein
MADIDNKNEVVDNKKEVDRLPWRLRILKGLEAEGTAEGMHEEVAAQLDVENSMLWAIAED